MIWFKLGSEFLIWFSKLFMICSVMTSMVKTKLFVAMQLPHSVKKNTLCFLNIFCISFIVIFVILPLIGSKYLIFYSIICWWNAYTFDFKMFYCFLIICWINFELMLKISFISLICYLFECNIFSTHFLEL
jgi:hypothetical protein